MKRKFVLPLLVIGAPPAWAEVQITPLPAPTESVREVFSSPQIESRPSLIENVRPAKEGNIQPAPAPTAAPLAAPSMAEPLPTSSQTTAKRSIKRAATPASTPNAKANKPVTAAAQPTPPAPQQDPVAAYNKLVQPGIQAFDAQRFEEAYRILKEARPQIEAMSDVGLLTLLGLAAMKVGDEHTALEALRQAAELTEDDQFYQPYIDGLLQFKRYDEAQAVLGKMSASPERDERQLRLTMARANQAFELGDYAGAERMLLEQRAKLDAGGLELLGWIQYKLGKLDAAAEQFEAAYRKTPTKGSAQGLVFSLHRLKRYDRLPPILDSIKGPLDELISPVTREALAQGQTRFTVDAEARLMPATSAAGASGGGWHVRLEPNMRHKRGTPGEGRLTQSGVVATVQGEGESDSYTLQLGQQRADNGEDQAVGQYGYALWRHRFGEGFESRLGIGRSLSGGAVSAATLGEAGLGYYTADWGLGARLFRRGNEESLLALSGMRDTNTGLSWGRVLETGVMVDGYRRVGEWNTLFSLTRSHLTGEDVASNEKMDLYARALHPVKAVPGLALGPELYTSRFDKNLSAFEPGHGGYFSPERFFKIGVLANYQTQWDALQLNVLAGLGWGWSRQAAADGNPLTGSEPGKYAASSSNGVAYHGRIDGEWPLDTKWRLGFSLGGQKSPDYTDWRAKMYVQRHLAP
ncbi:MAG: cellulose synthase subunit BcsC-related outer membrane protein [Halothiobacillaceae bacterium]